MGQLSSSSDGGEDFGPWNAYSPWPWLVRIQRAVPQALVERNRLERFAVTIWRQFAVTIL